jgi:hypothetical protein
MLTLRHSGNSTRGTTFALAAFALGQAVQVNNAYLHPAGIAWLSLAFVLIVLAMRDRPFRPLEKIPSAKLLAALVAVQWVELLVWGLRWCRSSHSSIGWYVAGLALAGAGVGVMLRARARPVVPLAMLVGGILLAGAHVIRETPAPAIDTWYMQDGSSAALLRGRSPYGVRFRNIYAPDESMYGPGMVVVGWVTASCPYPPLSLIAVAPAKLLLGDVRWAHLLALAAAGVVIAMAAPPGQRSWGFWAAALLLLSPRSMLVILAAWTEPLVILGLAATLLCAAREPRWTWLALGLMLATKQYAVLLLPVAHLLIGAPLRSRANARLLSRAVFVAAGLTLPLLAWDPHGFLSSVVLMQVRQPFRSDALSFPALLAQLTGVRLGSAIGFLACGGAMFWAARRADRTPAGFASAAALALLAFFAFNKQAFCNYYFLVAAACSLTAALSAHAPAFALRQGASPPIDESEPFVTRSAA